MDFPDFDGTSPKLWIKNCESYFDVYTVPNYLRSKIALMHLTGNAAFWAQSLDVNVRDIPWLELCKAVCDRLRGISITHCLGNFLELSKLMGWLILLNALIA